MEMAKFRGFSKELEKYVYGFGYCESDYTKEFLKELDQENQDAYLYTNNGVYLCDIDSIGQYVGLTDCNSQELYTGDLVEVSIDGYTQSSYWLIRNVWDIHLWINESNPYYRVSKYEVMGNVFENKDMKYIIVY